MLRKQSIKHLKHLKNSELGLRMKQVEGSNAYAQIMVESIHRMNLGSFAGLKV